MQGFTRFLNWNSKLTFCTETLGPFNPNHSRTYDSVWFYINTSCTSRGPHIISCHFILTYTDSTGQSALKSCELLENRLLSFMGIVGVYNVACTQFGLAQYYRYYMIGQVQKKKKPFCDVVLHFSCQPTTPSMSKKEDRTWCIWALMIIPLASKKIVFCSANFESVPQSYDY